MDTPTVPDFHRHEPRVWAALQEEAPGDAVYRLAATLRDEGVSQADLYRLFLAIWQQLRNEEEDARHDAVLDTCDSIIGYCSSHMKLFPHSLGREEREAIEKLDRE